MRERVYIQTLASMLPRQHFPIAVPLETKRAVDSK